MRGRHLRLPSSSDEDENPNPNPSSTPNPVRPLIISDDDEEFLDAQSGPSPPSPPPPPPPPHESSAMEAEYPAVSPIGDLLAGLGLRLRPEWLAACAAGLERSGSGFERLDVAGKAKQCFEQFLLSDMNLCGAGVLPVGVHAMHKAELQGPFVLQVDEVINICSPLRERYNDVPAGLKRCLKLSMTDGIQRVFGMEYRPIRNLAVSTPAGFKVVIRNIHIRRGLLILVPEVLEVLGGMVESLVAAHKRLVDELNKPPRCKRRLNLLPLAKRASLAAWSSDNSIAQENNSLPRTSGDSGPSARAGGMAATTNTNGEIVIEEFDNHGTGGNTTEIPTNPHNGGNIDVAALHTQGNIIGEQTSATRRHDMESSTNPIRWQNEGNIDEAVAALHTQGSIIAKRASATRRYDMEPNTNPTRQLNEGNIDEDVAALHTQGSVIGEQAFASRRYDVEPSMNTTHQLNEGNVDEVVAALHTQGSIIGEQASATRRHDMKPSTTSATTIEALNATEAFGEVVHPLISSGGKETPFTYLAFLMAKWTTNNDSAPFIRGKIKCVLTGVKLFHFKERSTYELQVFVDDGSLISEVLIDHHVVHKCIGHSPEEVNFALSSSNIQIVACMRECLKRFQQFLAKFEGTMLMEINKQSLLPVALEMNQGCSTSNAWLLLRRLEGHTVPHEPEHPNLEPINLSP